MSTTEAQRIANRQREIETEYDNELGDVIRQIDEQPQLVTLGKFCHLAIRSLGLPMPDNYPEAFRTAISSGAISDALGAVVGSAVVRGSAAEPDTTRGWTTEIPVGSFKSSEAFALSMAARIRRLSRGSGADHVSIGLQGTTWRIARYAGVFVIDQQDAVDDSIGAVMTGVEQMGAAAARVRPDLVYSLLLSNPTMAYDSTALFHSDHGNLATAALDATSIAAAWKAMAGQTYTDEAGRTVHVNNRPMDLVVPPALAIAARTAVRNIQLGDGADLRVRVESRLGPAGVVDPSSDTTYTGTDTNWLLTARGTSPSIVVGALDGEFSPVTRRTRLEPGQWGFAWDVVLDIGATAIDHRAVYWSTGSP